MASKRKTRSSSTSSGDVVVLTADSNSANTQTKSTKKTRSSSSGNAQKKSRKKTNLDTASSAVETNQASETVPVIVDGNDEEDEVSSSRFLGDPVPDEEAKLRWPKRYQEKEKKSTGSRSNSDDEEIIRARCHYTSAEVDESVIYKLFDDAHVQGPEGGDHYICKIIEMFEAIDGRLYFTAQWYYRAKDTAIKDLGYLIEPKRVFFSEVQDTNPLDCLVEKLNIARLQLNVDFDAMKEVIPPCDYYCDTLYLLPYLTFVKLPSETIENGSESSSTISSETEVNGRYEVNSKNANVDISEERKEPELKLLDLYSGCGAMSTGLCQGGILSGSNIVTRWAVDLNQHACESLKLNHPETEVRNESAEIFLSLLKEWEKLCCYFSLIDSNVPHDEYLNLFSAEEEDEEADGTDCEESNNEEIFEVAEVHDIRFAEANKENKPGLYFKVSWKGYESDEDSWEPIDGLSNCKERIKDFVIRGFKSNILPLPGYVDVVCGGPPCQGISGFNRFRNNKNPLQDEKNQQLVVFMDIVSYLRPRFTLMENVVDLVKFSNGFLGRYALGRLVQMKYQSRLGIMAAGAYGLPQFRLRVFIWGAAPSEKLPQFPLPTHDVIVRGFVPSEFEGSTVAYNEGHTVHLQNKLILKDAIFDLPQIENSEIRDEIEYDKPPETEFQQFIRLSKSEMLGISNEMKSSKSFLHDHRSLQLNTDDYQRVCRIPKTKGACFRDLPCVRVRDNVVELNPDVKREYLPSGKPLVPDYAISFVGGTSRLPFARLSWDETVPTVVTRAEPHNQKILHPDQDRVLSIRENARLQGFPDFYKLCGPVKQRYMQVGNAVAVPVARALGYCLGRAFQGASDDESLYTLPDKFPMIKGQISSKI
ncbi:DNA (cytosine-5)-methyltransferase CMT3-like isoform X2 [Trifolium pratense]|uniref:DNA (cytosine-5)-methyltransferase CMT3-like isoform X2 n=1 Tax=Trifolium pratense TaxID=57577 RepID=UPI001E695695|nr:DNA (cytosine-5)-methyltransferase CMT3-like isoform X2 [Trifolium pratense]